MRLGFIPNTLPIFKTIVELIIKVWIYSPKNWPKYHKDMVKITMKICHYCDDNMCFGANLHLIFVK